MASDPNNGRPAHARWRLWALLGSVALAVVAGAPVSAQAQDDPDGPRVPTETEKETARTLMLQGRDKEGAGDLAGALDAYEAADALMRLPTTGLSVGRIRTQLGKLVEARTVLLRVGRFPVQPTTPAVLVKARDEAIAKAEALAARIPSLVVTLPEGIDANEVTIAIDGSPLSPTLVGRAVKVNPGVRRIRASRADTQLFDAEVELVEKEQKTVAIEIDPAALAAAAPAPASGPDATTGPAGTTAPPADAREDDQQPEQTGLPVVSWIGFGVAGAGLIAGGVAGAIALVRTSDLHDACPDDVCTPAEQGAYDDANLSAHVATVGFAVAGAGVALGIIGLLLDDSDGETAHVEPLIGPTWWGVRARF